MLSQRVRELEPAATLEMNARRLKLAASGRDIVNFGVGEPDFATPPFICEAAVKAIADGWTRYTAVAGVPELRAAVAEVTASTRGLKVAPENVVITCGAKHALSEALLTRVDRGDEVLIPGPYWVSYPDMIKICEGIGVPVVVSSQDGYKVTPAILEAAVSPRTVGMILNSPNNPTGVVYTREELQALYEFARDNDMWILSDEIYEEFVYEGEFASALTDGSKESVMLVSGVSKTFAMTGWRIGWVVTDRNTATSITRLQSHTASNPTAVSQAAAIAALTEDDHGFRENMVAEYRARRTAAIEGLSRIEGVRCNPPAGAFYAFFDVSDVLSRKNAPKSGHEFCMSALDKAGVALVPGEAFGVENSIRLSFACSIESVERGLAALKEFVDRID